MKKFISAATLAALLGLPTLASTENAPSPATILVNVSPPVLYEWTAEQFNQNGKTTPELIRVAGNAYDIIGRNASKSSFVGQNLAGMVIDSSNLSKANFTGANLAGATLKESNFVDAIFFGANLRGAILSGANFTNANFQGACLDGAFFDVSNFTGADFTGAILTGSKDNYSNFSGAIMASVDKTSSC